MVTLLEYVRDHKMVGTQSTGNMPLKHIRALTAQFVDPPELDTAIGEHIYKLRTEYDVWPLYFLHALAEVSELMSTAPGRLWRLGAEAPRFLERDPVFQLAFLLFHWWVNADWLIAYSFQGMGERLPKGFERITLTRLRHLRVESEIPFNKFADDLIKETGLTWTAETSPYKKMLLRGSIEKMVVNILRDFGAVECTYRPNPLLKEEQDIVSFKITPLGKALLEALTIQEVQWR
jgi:hypothetical protein